MPENRSVDEEQKQQQRKILVIEANPQNDVKLNDEIQKLQNIILQLRSSGTAEFEIRLNLSTRSIDLQKIILDYEPNIIHFCGHGTGENGLVFRDTQISTKALSDLFTLFPEHLKCVVLNACYSAIQAEEIVKHINYVIGMNQQIRDDAAIAFSTGFYLALAYGRTYKDAFKFGCNAIQLTIVEPSIDNNRIAEETRKLIPICSAPEITISEEYQKPILKIKKSNPPEAENIRHNLPRHLYTQFFGRRDELTTLLQQVCPQTRPYISIVHGIGGVGKTALAVEVAYLLLCEKAQEIVPDFEIAEFKAIIFASAKETYLTPAGIVVRPISQQTLQEIFVTISRVLEKPYVARASKEQQASLVYEILEQQKTLLIIDNLETITDTQEFQEIIGFIVDLPQTTQAILTSREHQPYFNPIELKPLSEQESLDLIQQQAEQKNIEISHDEAKEFYEFFGGIPVALIYAVGQRSSGYSADKILGKLDSSARKLSDDLAQFLFENSIAPLRGEPAHKLLMAMTLFILPPPRETLSYVAGLSTKLLKQEEGLVVLQKLSLLTEEKERYKILQITRQFALDEIEKYPDFKELAQNRLIEFYLKFTDRYGGKDWQDWFIDYNYLAQEWGNIQFVLSLCASLDKYEEVKQIWQNIDHFVDLSSRWQSRLQWWEWLADLSDIRADLTTYVKAKSEIAWTLILMKTSENKRKAENYLQEAWEKGEFEDPDTLAHIANHIAVYCKTEKQYEEALQWLNTQENLVARSDLPEKEKHRHKACIRYYRAEIYFLQNDFAQAKQNFDSVIELGTKIGWQRFTNYAQNNLVDILIEDNDLSTVERRLTLGLYWAERSKEKRCIAHWQASHARYEQAIENSVKAIDWAQKALTIFKQECMQENIKKMEFLLNSLQ